jgi:hypothetical protein
MKKTRMRIPGHQVFEDLDRMVLAEIDAIQREASRGRPRQDDPRRTESRPSSQEHRHPRSRERETGPGPETPWGDEFQPGEADSAPGSADTCFHAHPEFHPLDAADQEMREDYSDSGMETAWRSSPDLLSREEEVFVRHVVQWLRPRKTKDIIWSRVWSHLTEEEAEDFFSPVSEISEQRQEESSARDAELGTSSLERTTEDDSA